MSKGISRTALLCAGLTTVLILAFPINSVDAQEMILLEMDFEEDDGGLDHGGTGDVWEWGEPGSGIPDNPGPSGAGDGSRVWGCPLNGTYLNNTNAYLELPVIDTSQYIGLTLSFEYWMDLTIVENEADETGDVLGSDHCSVQISVDSGIWVDVEVFSGSRSQEWKDWSILLEGGLGNTLKIRFLVVDEPDGLTDNGFLVDGIEISAEQKPQVSLSLGPDVYIPPVVANGEAAMITLQVVDTGLTVPENSFITVYIESVGQTEEFYHRSVIAKGATGRRIVEWFPSGSGAFRGWINLTVGGEYVEGRSFNMRSFSPVYYDDSSSGTSNLIVENGESGVEWTTVTPPVNGFSMSGGKVLWYGSPDGGPNGTTGFSGPTWAFVETEWIDLNYYTDSFLYLYHRYEFLGPVGSSGGVIEALSDDGSWEVLEPMGFSYGRLKDNMSGPMGGSDAIVGSEDWGVDGFELAPFTGGSTRLRFSVAADERGFGEGWFLDDIMVVGEGYDPFDTEPPAPIEGLDLEIVDEGAVSIYWDTSLARDFGNYNIYLERFEFIDVNGLQPYLELGSVDQDSAILTDLDPLVDYWVAVTAVDIIGNEDPEVVSIGFRASAIDDNRPPIADIKIVGGSYARTVGEDIVFDGSGSRDPDGDPLTFFWTLPDGSTMRGAEVAWKADRGGEEREVVLIVKDSGGLSDTETITVDILDDDVSIYQRGDIWPFLVIVIPVVIIIVLLVLIVSFLRSSARRRLEKRLEKIGLDPEGFLASRGRGGDHSRPSPDQSRNEGPKVHDLVPVKTERKEDRPEVELIPQWKEPHKRRTERRGHDTKERHPSSVKVVIECPFCSELFKEKVEMKALREHHVMTVKCPHCGKAGDITP
ncbi:MAG: PKD domain-containing protein [Thermoplasmatota archaeon]